jgi:hypothetical protein
MYPSQFMHATYTRPGAEAEAKPYDTINPQTEAKTRPNKPAACKCSKKQTKCKNLIPLEYERRNALCTGSLSTRVHFFIQDGWNVEIYVWEASSPSFWFCTAHMILDSRDGGLSIQNGHEGFVQGGFTWMTLSGG